jgi:hypothetical protein
MSNDGPQTKRRFHGWTRDLHLYAGLFLSPFLLVFAISAVVLNHRGIPRPASPELSVTSQAVSLAPTVPADTLKQAKDILRQLGGTGEIDLIRYNTKSGRLTISVAKPGEVTTIDVDLQTKHASVTRRSEGVLAALIYLHMRPGQHLAMLRGNWVFMAAWTRVADAVVYGAIFLTISGVYLWWFFKAERRMGWILLVAGFLTVSGLVGTLA